VCDAGEKKELEKEDVEAAREAGDGDSEMETSTDDVASDASDGRNDARHPDGDRLLLPTWSSKEENGDFSFPSDRSQLSVWAADGRGEETNCRSGYR
jgi:hypothetical protein